MSRFIRFSRSITSFRSNRQSFRRHCVVLPNFAQAKAALTQTRNNDIPWADILLAAKEHVPA